MNRLVSIIIPVHNTEKYLRRCIRSAINQSYKDLEIILVDDGSTDDSLRICEECACLDRRVRVVSQDNHGVSHARNVGIHLAKGDYVYFADSDDCIDSNAISLLITNIEATDSQLAVGGYAEVDSVADHKSKSIHWGNSELNRIQAMNSVLDESGIGGYLWNKLFKSTLINKFQIHFDERISVWEDVLFVMDYISRCYSIKVFDDVIYYYCRREGSAVENSKFTLKLYSQLDAIRKLDNDIVFDDSTREYLRFRKARCCLGLVRSMASGKNADNYRLEKIRTELRNISRQTIMSLSLVDKFSWLLIVISPRLFLWLYSKLHKA